MRILKIQSTPAIYLWHISHTHGEINWHPYTHQMHHSAAVGATTVAGNLSIQPSDKASNNFLIRA